MNNLVINDLQAEKSLLSMESERVELNIHSHYKKENRSQHGKITKWKYSCQTNSKMLISLKYQQSFLQKHVCSYFKKCQIGRNNTRFLLASRFGGDNK